MTSEHPVAVDHSAVRRRIAPRRALGALLGLIGVVGGCGSAESGPEAASTGVDVGPPPVGSPRAASALPATPMSEEMKRVIEQLHPTGKGETANVPFAEYALIEFSRDVLTGDGVCAAIVPSKGSGLSPALIPTMIKPLLIRSPGLFFGAGPSGPYVAVPSNGDIRVITDASERIHAFADLETVDVDGTTFSVLHARSGDVAPLWRELQRSREMTVALDVTTAHVYDAERVPELVGVVEYLCGEGARARAPDWPSILEAERRAAEAVRADWPPRQETVETRCLGASETIEVSGTVTRGAGSDAAPTYFIETATPQCISHFFMAQGHTETVEKSESRFQLHFGDGERSLGRLEGRAGRALRVSGKVVTGNALKWYGGDAFPEATVIDVESIE